MIVDQHYTSAHTLRRCRKLLGKRKRADETKASRECKTNVTAHAGSPFFNANITHGEFLLLAWCWVNKLAADAAAKFCNVHARTAYAWYKKFRLAAGDITNGLSAAIWNGSEKMGGPGKTVQVCAVKCVVGVERHLTCM